MTRAAEVWDPATGTFSRQARWPRPGRTHRDAPRRRPRPRRRRRWRRWRGRHGGGLGPRDRPVGASWLARRDPRGQNLDASAHRHAPGRRPRPGGRPLGPGAGGTAFDRRDLGSRRRRPSTRWTRRSRHRRCTHATLLADGRVLFIDDTDRYGEPIPAQVWDPQTGAVTPTGSLAVVRAGHTATLLADGRVLVVGGGNTRPRMSEPGPRSSGTRRPGRSARRAPRRVIHLPHRHGPADGRALIVGWVRTRYHVFDPAAENLGAGDGD